MPPLPLPRLHGPPPCLEVQAFSGLTDAVRSDMYLHPHFRYYMREVRAVAYAQVSTRLRQLPDCRQAGRQACGVGSGRQVEWAAALPWQRRRSSASFSFLLHPPPAPCRPCHFWPALSCLPIFCAVLPLAPCPALGLPCPDSSWSLTRALPWPPWPPPLASAPTSWTQSW